MTKLLTVKKKVGSDQATYLRTSERSSSPRPSSFSRHHRQHDNVNDLHRWPCPPEVRYCGSRFRPCIENCHSHTVFIQLRTILLRVASCRRFLVVEKMDLSRSRRQSMRAHTASSGDKSVMTTASMQSQMKRKPYDSNGSSNDVPRSGSSKTAKLVHIESPPPPASSTSLNGTATTNKKIRNSTYIPPVQSREHNTRSRNGTRKEIKPVSTLVQRNLTWPRFGQAYVHRSHTTHNSQESPSLTSE